MRSTRACAMSCMRPISYAANLARHAEAGWDNAALWDDSEDIARLLRVDAMAARRIVGAPERPDRVAREI